MKDDCCPLCGQPLAGAEPDGDEGGAHLAGEGGGELTQDKANDDVLHQLLDVLGGKAAQGLSAKKPAVASVEVDIAKPKKPHDDEEDKFA